MRKDGLPRDFGGIENFQTKPLLRRSLSVCGGANAMNIGEKSSTDRPQPGTVGATVVAKSDQPPIWDG